MKIERDAYKEFDSWLTAHNRRPLLVRGARQVGKSFAVRSWVESKKLDLIEINFEEQPRYREIFLPDLVPERILDEILLLSGKNPREANKIIFFDEIQAVPQAITALRYFYEKTPDVPIIAAGSLIEFVLKEEGFPVGRIESLFLNPVSFYEFLDAYGKSTIKEYIKGINFSNLNAVPAAVHQELIQLMKIYFRVGGMPKVLSTFLATKDFIQVSREQNIIVRGYQDDFAKYAKYSDWSALQVILQKMGELVGCTRVKFAAISQEFQSAKLRRAIDLLEHAQLLHRVYPTHTQNIPLNANASHKYFKIIFLDIGLLHSILGFNWHTISEKDESTDICNGRFAEQYVGQELIAARSKGERYQLHYWDRPKLGSDAEIDYVIEYQGYPTPLEVKSGTRGKLKSLTQYILELSPKKAFVLSQRNVEQMNGVQFLPMYLAGNL